MTDHSENTWFRRNIMATLILGILALGGFSAKLMYSTVMDKLGSLESHVMKVTDDHEARIRALEKK